MVPLACAGLLSSKAFDGDWIVQLPKAVMPYVPPVEDEPEPEAPAATQTEVPGTEAPATPPVAAKPIVAPEPPLGVATKFLIRCGNYTLISKAVEGNYPNYRQVIPKDLMPHKATFYSHDIVRAKAAIKALPISDKAYSLRLIMNGTLRIKTPMCEGFDLATQSMISPGRVEVAVNPDYFQDALDTGALTLYLKDELSPLIFNDDAGAVVVVMPLRLN
jgi:hypothetical protein